MLLQKGTYSDLLCNTLIQYSDTIDVTMLKYLDKYCSLLALTIQLALSFDIFAWILLILMKEIYNCKKSFHQISYHLSEINLGLKCNALSKEVFYLQLLHVYRDVCILVQQNCKKCAIFKWFVFRIHQPLTNV